MMYLSLLTGFGTNYSSNFLKFQFAFLALFFHCLVIDSFERLWMGTLNKNIFFNASNPQVSILGPTFHLLYIRDIPYVICNIAIYADDFFLYY